MNSDELTPVLGSATGGLRFEPVLTIPSTGRSFEELDEPFAILSDVGTYSRVLLARVAMGENSTVKYFALKIQRSDYSRTKAADTLTNPQIQQRWEQERRNLAEFIDRGEEIVELSELGAAFHSFDETVATSLKPITFCKRMKYFFHPICPNCLSFLRDCTDESLLASYGLPSYQETNSRYLHCPQCSKSATVAEVVFYSYSKTAEEPPGVKVKILRRSELYRAWSRIFALEKKSTKLLEIDGGRHFPCFNCEHHETCYPSKNDGKQPVPAEHLLNPISFYEFQALPLQLLHIHYDDFSDLLGGATWEEFKQVYRNRGATAGQTFIFSRLDPILSSAHQFIFQHDRSGLFALEILRLKMVAFTQLCHGVRAIHRHCRQPHLDLVPASVMAFIMPSGRDLPARWNFQIKILDLAATTPFAPIPGLSDLFAGIFLPPHNYNRFYTSPIIKDMPFGHWEHLNATINKVEADENNGQPRIMLEVDLASNTALFAEFSNRDLLQIVLSSAAHGIEPVDLWARKIADGPHGGISVRGVAPAINDRAKTALEKSLGQTLPNCKVAYYKSYYTPCDVYSLGMTLFRTLLVNDRVDLPQVAKAIDRVIQRVSLDLEIKNETTVELFIERLQRCFKSNPEVFSKNAVLYRHDHRAGMRNAIPDELWQSLLIFGFRLITNMPGFSICSAHGDYDLENSAAVMERVLLLLQNLNTAIHAEIFGSQERNREMWEVCDEALAEFNDGLR